MKIAILVLAQLVFSQWIEKYPNVDSVSVREGVTYKFMAAKDMSHDPWQYAGATDWQCDDFLSQRGFDTLTIVFPHKMFDGKVHHLVGNNLWAGTSWWYLKTTDNTSIENRPIVVGKPTIGKTYVYDVNGKLVRGDNLRAGVYFRKTGKVTKRFIIVK